MATTKLGSIQERRAAAHRQRGVTLIEALVALLIMSFGMVALSGMQSSLRRSDDIARQRSDAMRLANADMERMRGFTQLGVPTPAQSAAGEYGYAEIASTASPLSMLVEQTTYSLTRTVQTRTEPPRKDVTITVTWTDRAGDNQTVNLVGVITPTEPKLSSALRFAPAYESFRPPKERHDAIPPSAVDLGGGISAAAPPGTSYVFWIFDNVTGRLTGICNVANRTLGTLTSADVASCQAGITGGALVVSGFVRYSTGTLTPSADSPSSIALPLSVTASLTTSAPTAPACYNDSSLAAAAGQTYASYMCAIYPDSSVSPPAWSGSIDIGTLPIAAGGYRICRYSADYNGDGSINPNEHPKTYSSVSVSLSRQNFLVIDYGVSCPSGTPANPSVGRFASTATAQHQP